jgi:hypothetical protein
MAEGPAHFKQNEAGNRSRLAMAIFPGRVMVPENRRLPQGGMETGDLCK